MLEIRINTENDLTVAKEVSSVFYVSGDCNEGNFPNNSIEWNMYNGSALMARAASYKPAVCDHGRFNLEVVVPNSLNPTGDYKIEVEIFGYDLDGVKYSNPFLGKSSIFVLPE